MSEQKSSQPAFCAGTLVLTPSERYECQPAAHPVPTLTGWGIVLMALICVFALWRVLAGSAEINDKWDHDHQYEGLDDEPTRL